MVEKAIKRRGAEEDGEKRFGGPKSVVQLDDELLKGKRTQEKMRWIGKGSEFLGRERKSH